MKLNHLNYFSGFGFVYCEKKSSIVHYSQEFADQNCGQCEMFYGSLQGEGVECFYEDPEGDRLQQPFLSISNPEEWEKIRWKDKFGEKPQKKSGKKYIVKIPEKK